MSTLILYIFKSLHVCTLGEIMFSVYYGLVFMHGMKMKARISE